jgi:hypothetical protein
MKLNTGIWQKQNFLSSLPTFNFPKHKYSMYVVAHSGHCISIRRCWIDVNAMFVPQQALVRNFLSMNMGRLILNSLTKKNQRSKNLCSKRDHLAKLFIAIPAN